VRVKRYNPTETTGIIPKNSGVLCFADEAQAEIDDLARQRDEALARAEKAEGLLERLREASLLNYYKETDFDDACLAESVFDTLSNAGYDMSSEAADRVFGSDK
jgi:hypothetical protein